MNYLIAVDNTFTIPNSPIKIEMAKYTDRDGYSALTQLLPTSIEVTPLDDDLIIVAEANTTVQSGESGSYSVLVTDLSAPKLPPQKFSFYVYDAPQVLSKTWLYSLFNSLLPNLYKSNNALNSADNMGVSAICEILYQQLVEDFYNAIYSVGENQSYNQQWEYSYIGINNFLQNVKYPADFLTAMMCIPTQTGIKMPDIAIFTSRLAFCITGFENPVSVYYNPVSDVYHIDVYSNNTILPWVLGISQLGINTFLGEAQSNIYIYILCKVVSKLLPISIKYQFTFLTYTEFGETFNSTQPLANEYINPAITYDAYGVINNYNLFNTKGYYKL